MAETQFSTNEVHSHMWEAARVVTAHAAGVLRIEGELVHIPIVSDSVEFPKAAEIISIDYESGEFTALLNKPLGRMSDGLGIKYRYAVGNDS